MTKLNHIIQPSFWTKLRPEIAAACLEDDARLVWSETKVRVREYNTETVQREETVWAKGAPGPKDGAKQRHFHPMQTRLVSVTIGRTPPPKRFENWVTASIGGFTGCGRTRTEALQELYRLISPAQKSNPGCLAS